MQLARFSTATAALLLSTSATAVVERGIDAETQLKSWKLSEGAFSLELIQRLPDQTRGFFLARGFSSQIADDIGTQCVLQTIGRNTDSSGGASIRYNLADWVVRSDSETRSIKFKEQWDQEWSEQEVNTAARLAFRWATFPTQQEFEPGGDYNWGMISFGLPPGSVFDLQLRWQQDNQEKHHWITQIECPNDR